MVFFSLGILEFPTMLSLSLTGGSLYGILEFFVMSSPPPQSSRGMTQGLGILEFLVNLSRNFRLGNFSLGILEFRNKASTLLLKVV